MKSIVLIEDDLSIQEVFEMSLDSEGYEITAYGTGTEILSGTLVTPDLFVLDKNISGTNGIDICRFLKGNEQYKSVPVILLSASPDIRELASEAGAQDVLTKPFSLKDLRQMVDKHIG